MKYDLMGTEKVKESIRERIELLKEEKVKVRCKVLYGSYCSKSKKGEGEFDWNEGWRSYMVGDIYKGWRWDWIRDRVKSLGVEKDVFVFSGKYGVIGYLEKISWYDKYFGVDDLEEGKEWVRDWCRKMIEKYGKFKLVYWIDEDVLRKSRQYVSVMEVMKEFDCELEIELI